MKSFAPLLAALATVAAGTMPTLASAQRWHDRHESRHAQKDAWKDVAIVGGVVGLIGAASHNPTLAALGAAGAVYGGVRYENEVDNDGYGHYGRRSDRRRWDARRHNDRSFGGGYDDRRRDDRYDDRRGSYGGGSYGDDRRTDDRRHGDRSRG